MCPGQYSGEYLRLSRGRPGFTSVADLGESLRIDDNSEAVEAVEITYDPSVVSYKKLLDYYWVNIDPFDDRGQFCDKGHSYLSAIFVANEEEKKIAEASREKVVNQFPGKKVVTPILMASTFYPIAGNESYHQDFYKNNSVRYNFYRWNCGRDQRLKEIWGDKSVH